MARNKIGYGLALSRRNWLRFISSAAAVTWMGDSAFGAVPVTDRLDRVAAKGREFLANLFDPTVDLLPEFRGSQTYWLFHDNYLAAKVLHKSHPLVAEKITKSLASYSIRKSGKIEILFDEAKEPLPFRHYKLTEVRRIGDKVIKTEIVTDQVLTGWEEYADLLLLATMALSDKSQANERFRQAMQMWDGMGFKDRVVEVQKVYATYKLALALIAAKEVGERASAHEAILERLLEQQSEDGGWITDYDRSGKPVGVANVETTSLAVLALDAVMK
jgi:hypothetical protein